MAKKKEGYVELSEGSPEKWQKMRLGRYLLNNLLIGLIFMLPGFGYILAIIFGIKTLFNCRKSKYKGEVCDGYSSPFGVGDTAKYNLKFWFRLLYSLLIILLWVALIGVLYVFVLSKQDIYVRQEVTGLLLLSGVIFCTAQIHAVAAFKNEIRMYACPQCKFANTVWLEETSEKKERDEWRKVGTGGGETVKTGSIYVNGSEVGSTYGKTQTYDKYQQYRTASWTSYYKCEHCGYEFQKFRSTTKAISGVYKG